MASKPYSAIRRGSSGVISAVRMRPGYPCFSAHVTPCTTSMGTSLMESKRRPSMR